ncbi:MAG: glutamine synthetase [Haloplasmataceae bacterium]|jgi:glutamine synthetase|nr:glutamine synthetase [Haloplasmataceae bacterium]
MQKISELFGSSLFNDKIMRVRLTKEVYIKLQRTINEGVPLEADAADEIANAMKNWALERGATHYTHWFQPMTGKTAEKHEALFITSNEGNAIEHFSGKSLIMGEGDASSFPNGGLRATFEARGYTVWDCTSPAFLKEKNGAITLCIPTAFCSYTGEALDKKTPLLRSIEALEKSSKRILKLFGSEPNRVFCTLGAEQEYFLIDKRLYQQRKDIIYTGRTLFGAPAPKGQDLSDHYYGSIKESISSFMSDLDIELWKLGIPVKTKHNEVAPGQHELAPIFTSVNIASDQNQMIMEALETIANRHNLVCLLHEKPFAGINGSGKHNNWSIATSEGINLLEPGETPRENTQFLVFLSAVIKAIDKYSELLRISASSYTNDYRLGGHEAPPAIISMFVGEQLEEVLQHIENDELMINKLAKKLESGVLTLPILKKDVTDRNRTSPFAFTGNKFEFRMVGSSQTIADPNIILNTIVVDVLNEFADKLEQSKNLPIDLQLLIRNTIKEHRRIIFNGNGYSEEWKKEAERRGLPILHTAVDAIPHFISEKAKNAFIKNKVLSESEIMSRYEIKLDDYVKRANIEATTMIHMYRKDIFPAVVEYVNLLSLSIINMKQTNLNVVVKPQERLLEQISSLLNDAEEAFILLQNYLKYANNTNNLLERSKLYRDEVLMSMRILRKPCDELELLVGKEYWPFPTYGDLLFRL